ncbi:MAG: inositol monophosphatase [Hyphomicrobiales bacterium]|nr:inositol monophosphatase [Hyphomicrobiales bacterium]
MDLDRVAGQLRAAAAREILPRFRALSAGDVEEKNPGDLVTVADRAAEAFLARELAALLPGSRVVGEEAAHGDPALLAAVAGDGPVWIVDPVDGTGNFAHGNPDFAVMVALRRGGETVAAWILDPLGGGGAGRMAVAERGGGAFLDGVRLSLPPAPDLAAMHGGVLTRYLPAHLRRDAEAAVPRFARVSAKLSAGHEYLDLLSGEKHFTLYYRTLPWDHAPGALMVAEAGGLAWRLDGTAYAVTDPGPGLLLAPDAGTWRALHDLLVPGVALVRP